MSYCQRTADFRHYKFLIIRYYLNSKKKKKKKGIPLIICVLLKFKVVTECSELLTKTHFTSRM